ncbi:MAG: shikimate dehydrogenase [Tatlockia sp.]|jgi:shikimate dehydrogenase
MQNHFAVMGNPIAHSLSPCIHQHFAEQSGITLCYEKMAIEPAQFESSVLRFFVAGGKGLNITLPFKERAFALAKITTQRAKLAKAANTLWMENNLLHADNTDGVGLLRDLAHYLALKDKSVLVLGAGGAARGILAPLLEAQVSSLVLANRTEEKAQILKQDFPAIGVSALSTLTGSFDLIINATSASLSQETLALSPTLLHSHSFCYDLAYAIEKPTPFVGWAKNHQMAAVDGLGMLVEQAAESFFIWHGMRPETKPVLQALRNKELLNLSRSG